MTSIRSRSLLPSLAITLALALSGTRAGAQGVLATDALLCQGAVGKAGLKFKKGTLKAWQKCLDGLLTGKGCDAPKRDAALNKAEDAFVAAVGKKCTGAVLFGAPPGGVGFAQSCDFEPGEPLESAEATCQSLPVSDPASLTTCLMCWKTAELHELLRILYPCLAGQVPAGSYLDCGTPPVACPTDTAGIGCTRTVAKAGIKFFLAKEKLLEKCLDAVNKGKITGPCPDAATSDKIATAQSKVATAIAKCTQVPPWWDVCPEDSSPPCDQTIATVPDIATCVGTAAEDIADELVCQQYPGAAANGIACPPADTCADTPLFTDPDVVFNGANTPIDVYMSALTPPLSAVEIAPTGQSGPATSLQFAPVPGHPNRIRAVVPLGQAAGTYDLIVMDATACPALLPQALVVTGSSTVTLQAVSPPFAFTGAQTAITIFRDTSAPPPGDHPFVALPRVFLFPSSPQPSDVAISLGLATLVDSATLRTVVPKNEPVATYDVIVVNPDATVGLLTGAFRVQAVPPPAITAVTPTSIASATGQQVTVHGTNFSGSVVTLPSCKDASGSAVSSPSLTQGAPSCVGQNCTQQATIDASTLPAGAVCILRLTNADASYDDYSAIGVTNASSNLNAPKAGGSLNVGRRALVAAAADATPGTRFLYAIGGDGGAAAASSPFSSVEFAPVDAFGNLGAWQTQKFSLGTARSFAASATVGRYIYVAGGSNGTNSVNTAERAMILDPSESPTLGVDDLVPAATGLDAGYWSYRVSATFTAGDLDNSGGESLPSVLAIVKLPALIGQKTRVVLTWTAPVDALGTALPNVAGYRIYRTATAGGAPGTEVLLGSVGAGTLTFTDDGTGAPGTETPLPLGSTGAWSPLPSMASLRAGAGGAAGFDPGTPGKFYVYALLGRTNPTTALTSYEYLPVTVASNGHQNTAPSWTTGVGTSAAARWQLGAWVADATVSSTITSPDTYVFLGGGLSAAGSAVNKVEAGKVSPGGDLGTISDVPKDFVSAHAGYGTLAGNGQLFTFGGASALPSSSATVANLVAPPPTLGATSWNGEGFTSLHGRYLMGSAARSTFVFLIGGQTDEPAAASTTTEVAVW